MVKSANIKLHSTSVLFNSHSIRFTPWLSTSDSRIFNKNNDTVKPLVFSKNKSLSKTCVSFQHGALPLSYPHEFI